MEVEAQVLQVIPSTIDRLLRPYRQQGRRRLLSTTKPGSLLKRAIPIHTFADWQKNSPGFLEVDMATGWVECQAVWGKGQERVSGALHHIAQRLPFPLLGLDSDNGGEFINHHLYAYCQLRHITFTRARPYKKNDNAYVEQKACP